MKDISSDDPMEHTKNIRQELGMLINHLRRDVEKVADGQAKALFEVTAEVLTGLQKAFTDYEQKNEPAWKS